MTTRVKWHTIRGAHAKIAAEDNRSGGKVGLLVLVIVFVVLLAIVLRLAEYSGRGVRHRTPVPPPAAAVLHVLWG